MSLDDRDYMRELPLVPRWAEPGSARASEPIVPWRVLGVVQVVGFVLPTVRIEPLSGGVSLSWDTEPFSLSQRPGVAEFLLYFPLVGVAAFLLGSVRRRALRVAGGALLGAATLAVAAFDRRGGTFVGLRLESIGWPPFGVGMWKTGLMMVLGVYALALSKGLDGTPARVLGVVAAIATGIFLGLPVVDGKPAWFPSVQSVADLPAGRLYLDTERAEAPTTIGMYIALIGGIAAIGVAGVASLLSLLSPGLTARILPWSFLAALWATPAFVLGHAIWLWCLPGVGFMDGATSILNGCKSIANAGGTLLVLPLAAFETIAQLLRIDLG